jgi:hypothetical protein
MKCLAVTTTSPAEALVEADRVVDSLAEVDVGTIRAILEHQKPVFLEKTGFYA